VPGRPEGAKVFFGHAQQTRDNNPGSTSGQKSSTSLEGQNGHLASLPAALCIDTHTGAVRGRDLLRQLLNGSSSSEGAGAGEATHPTAFPARLYASLPVILKRLGVPMHTARTSTTRDFRPRTFQRNRNTAVRGETRQWPDIDRSQY